MSEFFDALEKAKHIGEVIAGNISPEGSSDILQKGKAANIGEIREWSGKKYRKQANGNWVEVSEHGMSKKEHKEKYSVDKTAKTEDEAIEKKKHYDSANSLSDKEHSDEEVGIKEEVKSKNLFDFLKLKGEDGAKKLIGKTILFRKGGQAIQTKILDVLNENGDLRMTARFPNGLKFENKNYKDILIKDTDSLFNFGNFSIYGKDVKDLEN